MSEDHTIEYTPIEERAVDPLSFPIVYMTPKFPAPSLLSGRTGSTDWEILGYSSKEDMREYFEASGSKPGEGFYVGPLNPNVFMRMICKIAHSYAVAEFGLPAFIPCLENIIRGFQEPPHAWVGCLDELEPPAAHLHEIGWEARQVGEHKVLIVNIRLFSFVGTPTFQIVVGALHRSLDELPFLKQPIHAIDVEALPPIGDLTPVSKPIRAARS